MGDNMKLNFIFFICCLFIVSGLFSGNKDESYYWESISTPSKSLNFTIILFTQKYKWTESKSEGNYSTLPLGIKNKNTDRELKWDDLKIYIQFKDNSLIHNYKTVAKSGIFSNVFTIEPDKNKYQMLCFGKKFDPKNIKRVYIKIIPSNFIQLRYYSGKAGNMKIKRDVTISNELDPEAKRLLLKFLDPNADYKSLTQALKPTEADYKAYFTNNSWKLAITRYNELWKQYPFEIKPNPGQTELLFWSSSIEDIKYGTGNASKFPGGYKHIINKIEPGHIIYRFKFVKPGKNIGMAFDGLVKVNGRWVIFPKPWRIFRN